VLLILHIVMPLIAWATGNLFFSDDPFTVTGLILAMSIPTGISSMIWVSVYKGNIPVTLSLILADTLLSPFVVPYSLSLLAGSKVSMDVWGLMTGLFLMVVLPSLLGMLLNHLTSGRVKSWGPWLSPFSKFSVVIVIAINGAVVSPYLRSFDWKMLGILVCMLIISSFGYFVGWFLAKLQRCPRDMAFSIVFNSGMRNTVAGVALATSFFPMQVSIPVIVATIFQQLLASQIGYLINKFHAGQPLPAEGQTVSK
jgi:predicted Na+-dependent transporter